MPRQSVRDEQLAHCEALLGITTLDIQKQKVALCSPLSRKFIIIRLLALSLPMMLRSHNYFQFLGMGICRRNMEELRCAGRDPKFGCSILISLPMNYRKHTEGPRAQKSPNKGFRATALCIVSHCGEVLFLMWEDMNNGLFQLVSFHR